VGLHASDLRCLDLLLQRGPLTAGRLAELTGLTTGSMTALIDRLEKAGYVQRGKDPHDRRRVVIEPVTEKAMREIGPLFESMGQAMMELCSRYTPEELALIVDFVRRTHPISEAEIAKLKG
jgi:DNA-binding MarR family transcriptional regulator